MIESQNFSGESFPPARRHAIPITAISSLLVCGVRQLVELKVEPEGYEDPHLLALRE
jgi:hypothetical protein